MKTFLLFNLIVFSGIMLSNTRMHSGNIVFFGDSLTAGYGLQSGQAFPAHIEARIKQRELNYRVVNAGLSGETTAGGVRRIDWLLRNPIDVFVLSLGANDGLRGLDLDETERNLQTIINKVKEKNPEVILIISGMQMPPNLGPEYTEQFRDMYERLAMENDARLIPFLLENVAGEPELNLSDGIHPNAEGHKIMAETVWQVLEAVLSPE